MVVDGKYPSIVSFKDEMTFDDTLNSFELLFLNRTNVITPRLPYNNFLFIRNLYPEELDSFQVEEIQQMVEQIASTIPKQKKPPKKPEQSINPDTVKKDPTYGVRRNLRKNIKVEQLLLEKSDNLLKGPIYFRDNSLSSQKMPFDLRKKMFEDVLKDNIKYKSKYILGLGSEYKQFPDAKGYYELGPNQLRPILEVSNGVRTSECASDVQTFPYANLSPDKCLLFNERPEACDLHASKKDMIKGRKCQFYTHVNRHPSEDEKLDLDNMHMLTFINEMKSVLRRCQRMNKSHDNIYDRLKESFWRHQKCGMEYSSEIYPFLMQHQMRNRVTEDCPRKGKIYNNFLNLCGVIQKLFSNIDNLFQDREDCLDTREDIFKEYLVRRRIRHGALMDSFYRSFRERPMNDPYLWSEIGIMMGVFDEPGNHMAMLSSRFKTMSEIRNNEAIAERFKVENHHSYLNSLKTIEILKKSDQTIENIWLRNGLIFSEIFDSYTRLQHQLHDRAQLQDLFFDRLCVLVQYTHRLGYLPKSSAPPSFADFSLYDLRQMVAYFYHKMVGEVWEKIEVLNLRKDQQHDIFSNSKIVHLSKLRLIRLLRAWRQFMHKRVYFFLTHIIGINNFNFESSKIIGDVPGRKLVEMDSFKHLISMCYKHSRLASPYWRLRQDLDMCVNCDPFDLYIEMFPIPESEYPRLRDIFVRLMAKMFSPSDLTTCVNMVQSEETTFTTLREVKVKVEDTVHFITFPLYIARDRLLFETDMLDLGVSSHPDTFHSVDIKASNKSKLPLILKSMTLFFDSLHFDVKIAMFYREHVLVPFQKERFLLARLLARFKRASFPRIKNSLLEGYVEVDLIVKGQNEVIRERVYFKMRFASNILSLYPGNRLSLLQHGLLVKSVSTPVHRLKRFTIKLANKSPFPFPVQAFLFKEFRRNFHKYDFFGVLGDVINDKFSPLQKHRTPDPACAHPDSNCAVSPDGPLSGHETDFSGSKINRAYNYMELRTVNTDRKVWFGKNISMLRTKEQKGLFILDHAMRWGVRDSSRAMLLTFKIQGGFFSTRLEFVPHKIECVSFKSIKKIQVNERVQDCFVRKPLEFGYFSKMRQVEF